jgi:malonyl CoA-acyl carrier protein transacylase/NADP-dependent 3-hydroxy acid dehydrogenase YdfG/acyl carrier protein
VFSAAERSAAADALKSTRVAQPAIGAASLAVFSVLRHAGLRPDSVAGHSFGEVSALHAAGAVDLASALQISRKRGALMAEAAGLSSVRGTMLAVTAHAADVTETLTKARCEAVSVANHNAPRQVVLSGAEEAIEQADRALAKAGFVTQKLAVDTAFHSPMMHASLAPFEQFLQGVPFAAPATEMVSASSALPIERSASACRAALANAIVQPVRFVETIERLYESGVRYFIEAGPGTGLTALTGQILSSRPHLAVATDRKGQNGVTSLWRALGKLAVAGVPLSLAALWDEFDIGRDPRTRVKSGAEILIDGVNTGRKYPPVGGAAALPKPVVREAVPEPLVSKQPAAEPAPPIAQPAPAPVPLNTPDPQWMATFQEVQRQTAEAHMAYQRSVAETHMAFLRSAEAAAAGLSGRPSNGKTASPAFVTAPTPVRLAPIAKTEPPPFVMQAAPVIPTREAPAQSLVPAADLKAQTLEPPVDLETFLLTVVAEKTGYPREVLKLDMSLENDLGIDSIKRVEIFSSFKGRIQSAGKLDLKEMSRLATLRDVYRFLQSLSGETSAASAEAPGAPLAIASSGIERYVVTSHITRAPGQPLPGLYSGDIAIVGDPIGAGRALAARLKQHGIAAAVHRAVPANTAGLIYLEALRDFASVEDALQSGREAFLAARAFARSNAAPALFVTVQDSDSPSRAWSAGLSALAKTAGQEWPGVAVKALQLERGTRSAGELAEAIAQELLEGGRDVEVNLSASGERRVLEARPIAGVPHSAAFSLGAARTVIVSGGARGITPVALADFAAMHRPRLVLLGRTEMIDESAETVNAPDEAALKRTLLSHLAPNGHAPDLNSIAAEARRILAAREIRSNLRSLAATGAEVHYEPVDIRDSAALAETLARVREKWGPIGGLIHAAGVIADKRIAEKNDAQFDAVFSTKVTGLRNLLDATRQDALRLIVLFSSIAARLGNPGQCDYAMANAILSRIAASEAHARASHCLVKSIEWGPWEAGMAGPLAAHFRNQGIATISLAQGAKLLLEELSFPDHEVVLAQIPASAQKLRNEAAEISEPALTAGL